MNDYIFSLKNTSQKFWLWIFATGLCWMFGGCTVQQAISKDDYQKIPERFSGKFYDRLDTLDSGIDNSVNTRSFIGQLTNIQNINYVKPIKIDIKGNQLYFSFEDNQAKQYVLKFYGRRRQKKFVFYTNYETVSFPILYVMKTVTKYSVYMPTDREILFEDNHSSGGMILLFGAESAYQFNHKFKLLPNE